ncbi:hypothetical protein ABES02_04975 [Neobacillus pocheonensis]
MEKLLVIYNGKEYVILQQYASGFCEISEEGAPHQEIILVHFSELSLKK